jgi:hypothetical protein
MDAAGLAMGSFTDGSHFRKDSDRQMSGQPIQPVPSMDGCCTVWERSADETGQFHPNDDIKPG